MDNMFVKSNKIMLTGVVFAQLTHVHSKISYLEVRTSLKSYDEIHDYTIIFWNQREEKHHFTCLYFTNYTVSMPYNYIMYICNKNVFT